MHLRSALAFGLSGLLLALPGCASRSTPATTAVSPAPASLPDALQALFADPELEHASWGVQVRSLSTGKVLYALNPSRLLVPASNQKLLTVAAAAETLGWDYRFTTRVLAAGTIGDDGTLSGDLIVVGHRFRNRLHRPGAPMRKARGIRDEANIRRGENASN